VPQCARCGSPVALDPRSKAPSGAPANLHTAASASAAPLPLTTTCPTCSVEVEGSHRFCPACGGKMPPSQGFDVSTKVGPRSPAFATAPVTSPSPQGGAELKRSTLFFGGAVQAARAKLTLIRGDGEDGISFTLAGQDHLAGRGDCPISFPDDPFLSPTHANFTYVPNGANGNQLVVRDMGSLNGIYVRLAGKAMLQPGAKILVGEQVLGVAFARTVEDEPDHDGTYFSSSMVRSATLEITQHLRGGNAGWVFRTGPSVVIGREGNDINFPDDPFISGRHAEVKLEAGALSVTDLGSRNGTFVRVSGEQVLKHGDYVFLGQQLLRVEIV
jgi:pSer/pThr/pTyr-binding forkhead associated (FHA) protein